MTASFHQLIIFLTVGAFQLFEFKAALDHTLTSFQSEIRKTISALTSLVSNATSFHRFADASLGQEEATITSNAFIVVVSLAVMDLAITVSQNERSVTLFADVIDLVFATQNRVHHANVVVKTVASSTVGTSLARCVGKVGALFDGFLA